MEVRDAVLGITVQAGEVRHRVRDNTRHTGPQPADTKLRRFGIPPAGEGSYLNSKRLCLIFGLGFARPSAVRGRWLPGGHESNSDSRRFIRLGLFLRIRFVSERGEQCSQLHSGGIVRDPGRYFLRLSWPDR